MKIRYSGRHVVLPLLLLVLFCTSAKGLFAQAVSATLLGTVTDKLGAVTVGANVTVVEKATNISHTTTTNASGNYTLPDLSPGTYSVTIEAPTFRRETRANVDVIVNTTVRVDFELSPGDVTESIMVTDAPPMLQTDRADVSTKLEAEKFENLPVGVNRNFQSLLNLVPGTAPASFQHSQFFNAQSSLQTEVNGLPRMGNSYQIEGVDDDERTGLLQIMIPPADAIETVDMSTNNFEAELGRAIGAVTNVTLKSGTNKWHGSASEYFQNSYLNARSYFSNVVGHVAYNYFGGNISGPVLHDKLFFYFDYFRTADHEANANTMTIPFKKSYTCNSNGFIDLSDGYTPNGRGQVYDPNTGNADGTGRQPFAGNLIPCARANSVSLALLNMIPAPNTNLGSAANPANNYFVTLPFQKTSDTYDAKVDWQISSTDRLSYRYGYQKSRVFQAPAFSSMAGGPANGGFAGIGNQAAFSTAVNYNHTFSPTLLTEARFGVAHYRSDAQPSDYGKSDATTIGIPGVNIDQLTSGQVGINLGSFSQPTLGYSASVPWIRGEANIDFVNHWTKVVGNHSIKFGVDLRRVRDDLLQGQTYSPRGIYTFGQNQTALNGNSATDFHNDIASFLLDLPSSAGRDLFTYFPAYRQWWLFAFAGDKWQATPRLTLDYGVRWEFYPPATPRKSGGFSNYNPINNTLDIAGVGGNPSNLGLKTRYTYFAPRTGFAYRFGESTVLRGGFGMSYMPFEDNNYAYNYPIRANNAYTTLNAYSVTVLADGVTPATFQNGFPAPVAVNVPSTGIINVTSNTTLNSSSFYYVPKNYYNPYVESWNVMVQQALPGNFSLQVGYVANHGVHLGANNNINLPSTLGGGSASSPQYAQFRRTAAVNEIFIGTSSNYQSLQVQVTRRMTKGFSNTTAFTWGKGLGYFSGDDGGFYFFQDLPRNYAPMDYDRRLNLQESFTYELPFGPNKPYLNRGVLSRTIGGWKLSSVLSFVTGTPFSVTANGGTLNTPGWTQTANMTGPFKVLHHGPGHKWFDTTSFSQPAGCTSLPCSIQDGVTVGNTGRNQFYGPGYVQNNFSLFKTFALAEPYTVDVRLDAFQLSNTPQFANPQNSLTSATFGQITSTMGSGSGVNGIGGGRTLQLAAIFKF